MWLRWDLGVTMWVLVGFMQTAHGQLKQDFYRTSCPQVESLISASVQAAASVDASIPPKLLRLIFHDCFVEGCDASILLDSTATEKAEKDDPANANLQGLGAINGIKRTVELVCKGVVSCADIIALAARDAVVAMGGPRVEIPTGRFDGLISSAANVRSNLPDTPFSVEHLLEFFTNKGLDLEDLVALSGAHTVGVAHCTAFNDRFSFSSNGTVEAQDPSMDPAYAAQLVQKCPGAKSSDTTLIVNDLITPTVFDNAYFTDVQKGHGLFHSDAVLLSDPRTASLLQTFVTQQDAFFSAWAASFTKLSLVATKSQGEGEVRKQCNLRNS